MAVDSQSPPAGTRELQATEKHVTRHRWVDVAKAVAICLVVLYHVAVAAAGSLLITGDEEVFHFWARFSETLKPIRMPLFFLVSGILAARAIQRSWRAIWRGRVMNLLWPFVLWSVAFSLIAPFRYNPENPSAYAAESLATIPFGGNAYWFLSVLVLLFVLARIFREHLAVTLIVAIVLFGVAPLVTPYLDDHTTLPIALTTNIGRVAYFAIWYFLGIHLARVIHRAENRTTLPVLISLVVAYALISGAHYFAGVGSSISSSLYQLLAVLGLGMAVTGCFYLGRVDRVARVARYLSQRTLAIYVLHPLLLVLLIVFARAVADRGLFPQLPVPVQYVIFPVVAMGLVAASVLIYDAAQRIGLKWLFQFPGTRAQRRDAATEK